MQDLQPMQASWFRSMIPSGRRNSAPVGQMVSQGASAHWLHSTGKKERPTLGNTPFSTDLTQQRLTPTAT